MKQYIVDAFSSDSQVSYSMEIRQQYASLMNGCQKK